MKKALILIVDDRPENLLTLEHLLEDDDVGTVRAESGYEALDRTLDHDFALILLDVQMPGMDGYETAELLRGNKKTKHIPIVFVTAALKERDNIFRGYDSGAVDYMLKPLEPTVLKSKVNIFLEMYRRGEQLKEKTRELDMKIVELEELQQQLEETNEQLRLLSTVDGLTGLLNRRRFDEILEQEWLRGARNKTPLSVVLVDIDHFKAFNDYYGHIKGDKCLRIVAGGLSDAVQRHVDRLARYGGEEFAAILPDTDLEGAEQVANRIRESIEELNVEHKTSSTAGNVTVCVGVASMIPDHDAAPTALLEYADRALYLAKASGRNQCRVFYLD